MAWTLNNIVNKFYNPAGSGSQATAARSHPAGSLIAVGVFKADSNAITSVTNTAGDTFLQATNALDIGGSTFIDIWYVLASAGNASDVVTVHALGSGQGSMFAANYTYAGTASFNVANHGDTFGGANTTVTTGALATVAVGDLLVAVTGFNSGGIGGWTAGSGCTIQSTEGTGQGVYEDNQSASAGSQTVSITNATSTSALVMAAAAFSVTAGASTTLWAQTLL